MPSLRCLPFFSVALALAALAIGVEARPESGHHVRVDLVAEHKSIRPGTETTLGLGFHPDPGWHLYWRNPGDSGEPPEVKWTLPEGVRARPIRWPAPRRVKNGPVVNYVYSGDLLLPVTLRIDSDFEGRSVEIVAEVAWLVCRDQCLAEKATLRLQLPVSKEPPVVEERHRSRFANARGLLPHPLSAATARVSRDGVHLVLDLAGDVAPGMARDAAFEVYPWHWKVLSPEADVSVEAHEDRISLRVPLARGRKKPPTHFGGVLIVEREGRRTAYSLDLAVKSANPDTGNGKETK